VIMVSEWPWELMMIKITISWSIMLYIYMIIYVILW
jgi:hypothetical protein